MEGDGQGRDNRRAATRLALLAVLMVGFGYALVPLYDVFCDITGLNGKVDYSAPAVVSPDMEPAEERWVTVIFDANVQSQLPWSFKPEVTSMRVRAGVPAEASYVVSNTAGHGTTGQAVPSVAPGAASRHMLKMECFCFSRQTLAAGEDKVMPLKFVISPQLPEEITSLTLSYTFFNVDLAQGETQGSDNNQEG